MSSSITFEETNDAAPAEPTWKASFYETLVMRTLRSFNHGALRMVWPDGRSQIIGSETEPVSAEVHLRNTAFFKHVALYGNVGFGESYVHGDWDTPDISAVISWFILNIAKNQGATASSAKVAGVNLLKGYNRLLHLLRPNSVTTSRRNIAEHYDLGNDFYSLWLDKTMTYSAARFEKEGQNLEEAQYSKYDALCKKLELKPSDHVLEIGCGWGGFCSHAARNYGCKVTAVTISKEQHAYATERVKREGLEDKVEVRLQDYRHVTGQFDKIASIEMLEAVGDKFLETWFSKCHEVLKPDGLLAFQAITTPDSRHANLRKGVDWIQKHIFPGSLLLSVSRLNEAANRTGDLFLHGLEDLGAGYAKTLQLWHDRFNEKIDAVKALGFDHQFVRKWNFYLKYCEAAFATRNISVIQAVYTRPNNPVLHKAW
jgi:cyclopropane-fatty-acyl-phospholipid synthase